MLHHLIYGQPLALRCFTLPLSNKKQFKNHANFLHISATITGYAKTRSKETTTPVVKRRDPLCTTVIIIVPRKIGRT